MLGSGARRTHERGGSGRPINDIVCRFDDWLMLSRSIDRRHATLGGAVLALWTWIVVAALAGWALARALRELPAEVQHPTTFGESFVAVLTLDIGQSILYREPAVDVVVDGIGRTAVLLAETMVLFALFAGGLVALAQYSDAGRRVAIGLSYAGAFPAAVWLVGLWWIEHVAGVPVGVESGHEGGLLYIPGAAALAVPLAAMVGRLVTRDAPRIEWIVDGWLFISWLFGALVLVELTLETFGIGYFLVQGVTRGDPTLATGALMVLLTIALIASVVRELAWGGPGRPEQGVDRRDGQSVKTDGGATADDLRRLVERNWRVRTGIVGLGVMAIVGVAGSILAVLDVTGVSTDGVAYQAADPVAWIPLVHVQLLASGLAIALVAAVAGLAIGRVTARSGSGRVVAAVVVGFAMNVPLYLWTVVFGLSRAPLPVAIHAGPVQVLLGLAVAPLVGVVAARDLPDASRSPLANQRRALGVAAVGAGVGVLAYGYARGFLTTKPVWIPAAGAMESIEVLAFRLAVGVGLPAVALFLVGDGLREA